MLAVLCLSVSGGCSNQSGKISGESETGSVSSGTESANIGTDINPSESETQDSQQGDPGKDENAGQTGVTVSDEDVTKISNNGGFFVGVEDRVYYREYGPYSMSSVALYGDFLLSENFGGAQIKYLDPGMTQPAVLCDDDDGYGALYYYDGYLYSTREEVYGEPSVYRINVTNGQSEKVADGYLVGGSSNGRYLAVTRYEVYKTSLIILDGGKESTSCYCPAMGYVNYVGQDGDKAFFTLTVGDEEDVFLMQYDYANNLVNLAKLPKSENSYMAASEVHNFVAQDGKLKCTWEYYEGTGHFLSDAYEVEIPECANPEGADSTTPMYEAISRQIPIWDEQVEGSYSQEYLQTQIKDSQVSEIEESLTKWLSDGKGTALIPQKVEKVKGGIYCVVAQAHRYAFEDIGWREAYIRTKMQYLFYPEGSKTAVKLGEVAADEGAITAYVWLVGKAGEESAKILYQMAEFYGPETETIEDQYLFGAELSPDLVYEFPEGGDIYDDWVKGNIQDFYKEIKSYRKAYTAQLPELDSYQGYQFPKNLKGNWQLVFHLGFDEDGRVNYIRPVVMD